MPFRRRHFPMCFLKWNIAIKFSLKFIPKGPIKYIPILVPIMAWGQAKQWWPILLTHICVTWPELRPWQLYLWCHYKTINCTQCLLVDIYELCPNDTIWRHESGSAWAQVMSSCFAAPRHQPKHCWLSNGEAQWHSSEGNFTRDTPALND